MKECSKTAGLMGIAGAVLLLSLALIFLSTPTPFLSYVAPTSEIVSSADEIRSEEERQGRLNINTASKDELLRLPGMTEDSADEILQLRRLMRDESFLDISQWLQADSVTLEQIEEWRELTICE